MVRAERSRSTEACPVFATGDHVLVGHGPVRHVGAARRDDADLGAQLRAALGDRGGIAFGTFGFEPHEPARFVVPTRVERVSRSAAIARFVACDADGRVRERIEPWVEAEFATAVEDVLGRMARDRALTKVVLGRWLHLRIDPAPVPDELVGRLLAAHDHAHVFGMPIDATGTAFLVGASPELLVSRFGRTVRSRPLAGSAPRSKDPREDRRRAQRLLASGKDRHEHALVVESIATTLGGLCDRLQVGAAPSLVATDTMWHLATDIVGELRPAVARDVVDLVGLLHPTPAVCGTPTALARTVIAELEPSPRGVMTGAVGWMDGAGDGMFAVTIRSALLDGPWVRMFAGAGIVAGSDPLAEARETTAKLGTMRDVVGPS